MKNEMAENKAYGFKFLRLLLPEPCLCAFLLILSLICPLLSFSQITTPPTIVCVTTDESSGDVTINWTTPPLDPCGSFVAYVLLGATSFSGPYLSIDTITNITQTSVQHPGANATILDWYYFMVTLQNCPGATIVSSDTVLEEVLYTPELDYITVTPVGVQINWIPSSSPQAVGYYIYYGDSNGFALRFDTVYGRLTDSYTDINPLPGFDPNEGTVEYTIAAFDGCGTPTPYNDSVHRTIFLTASIEPCLKQVSLNWTPYRYWPGISAYQIELSTDNSPFSVMSSFNDGSYGYNFSLDGISADSLCFRTSAVRQNDAITSISNEVCFAYNQTLSTAFNYMRNVSVNSAGNVDIEWYVDSAANITSFDVERSIDGSSFAPISTIPVTNPIFLNNSTDGSAPTSAQSFYYQVRSFDLCDSRPSTTAKTILLSGTNNGNINTLNWNAFELENATVVSYTIYRVENSTLVPDTTVSPSTLSFDDIVVTAISEDGTFCYVVEANFNLDLPFVNENLQSTSNQICLFQTPVVYVPNAFVPGGKNNYFKPTLLNPNISEYEFAVFDRWGKKLFETNLINTGWDGTHNGELLPLGGYAYYIKLVSKGGVAQEKKGTVVLVR